MSRARDNANAALAVADLKGSFPRAISGLTIARETATSFSVSAGMAANENGSPSTALLKMSVPMTKTLGSFAVGTGNGALDFGPLPAGATLPRAAIDSPWIAGDVTRDLAGVLTVPLILPHGANAPEETLFPQPLLAGDGPVALPRFDVETTDAED